MVAREKLTMLAVNTPWDQVVRTLVASPFSRLPVYADSPDHIVGILRAKDLVERYVTEGRVSLDRLTRPVVHLPEDLPADRVLTQLREKRVHAGIVVDASGRAIGLITIQDVLEELLGQRPSQSDAVPGAHTPTERSAS